MANTIADALSAGERILSRAEVPDYRSDANLLLRETLGIDQAQLIVRAGEQISAEDYEHYLGFINRRALREPVQYILGRQEFYGLEFTVTPEVLIPRPETEFLVERAIQLAQRLETDTPLIVDVGTGSGCVAVSIARHLPGARIVATDISEAALTIARGNADRHGVEERVEFLHGDLLNPLRDLGLDRAVDLIVSNPPYVPETTLAGLQPEVRDYEPWLALTGGEDGLDLYRRLFDESRGLIRTSGLIVLEIGYSQLDSISSIASEIGWERLEVTCDLQSIPRAIVFRQCQPG